MRVISWVVYRMILSNVETRPLWFPWDHLSRGKIWPQASFHRL